MDAAKQQQHTTSSSAKESATDVRRSAGMMKKGGGRGRGRGRGRGEGSGGEGDGTGSGRGSGRGPRTSVATDRSRAVKKPTPQESPAASATLTPTARSKRASATTAARKKTPTTTVPEAEQRGTSPKQRSQGRDRSARSSATAHGANTAIEPATNEVRPDSVDAPPATRGEPDPRSGSGSGTARSRDTKGANGSAIEPPTKLPPIAPSPPASEDNKVQVTPTGSGRGRRRTSGHALARAGSGQKNQQHHQQQHQQQKHQQQKQQTARPGEQDADDEERVRLPPIHPQQQQQQQNETQEAMASAPAVAQDQDVPGATHAQAPQSSQQPQHANEEEGQEEEEGDQDQEQKQPPEPQEQQEQQEQQEPQEQQELQGQQKEEEQQQPEAEQEAVPTAPATRTANGFVNGRAGNGATAPHSPRTRQQTVPGVGKQSRTRPRRSAGNGRSNPAPAEAPAQLKAQASSRDHNTQPQSQQSQQKQNGRQGDHPLRQQQQAQAHVQQQRPAQERQGRREQRAAPLPQVDKVATEAPTPATGTSGVSSPSPEGPTPTHSAPTTGSMFKDICRTLQQLYEEAKDIKDGMQADYIPELAAVNPELFAIAAVSCDGETWVHGDAHIPFTLQSTCKPLLYCLAQSLVGWEEVHDHIGYEPSGQRFNAFALDEDKNPHNPMLNAGAIMSSAIIWTHLKQKVAAYKAVKAFVEEMAGHVTPVTFDNSVYLSELATASRNFALTYFMSETSQLLADANIQEVLELYFSACSLSCDCLGLAAIAATFANGGVSPITESDIMSPEMVQNALSLMYNCGMYDYSGRFAFEVGIPAKSGVSGALFLSVPGKLGIAIWSPRLDRKGNSVRGLHVAQRLVEEHRNLHVFGNVLRRPQRTKTRVARATEESLSLLLIQSAAHGKLDVVKRIIEFRGVGVDETDVDGRTALHEAIVRGHEKVATYLISKGASCVIKDKLGNTPCSDAAHHNLTHVLPRDVLLQHVHQPSSSPTSSADEDDVPFFQRKDRSPASCTHSQQP
ncbi:glutaminase [Salpingoeca rosetta]|uniref:glutaminase n=1 Tax=Salpingoeca rosetta (strain ATCC 50818 / BSB-021) TaxID=946362 RepID=F2U7J5_SALR5|nr:glutaminase [Salpingoeca rosetta]EGD83412.1 glutaminase [Salpingoeca rosetta]|eukprot:XP_004994916.1 glutaminase [Salpingoeca rosetta]